MDSFLIQLLLLYVILNLIFWLIIRHDPTLYQRERKVSVILSVVMNLIIFLLLIFYIIFEHAANPPILLELLIGLLSWVMIYPPINSVIFIVVFKEKDTLAFDKKFLLWSIIILGFLVIPALLSAFMAALSTLS